MSRERAPFVAQGTWRSGALHVWGWNGESPASAAWLYGGFGRSRWSGRGDAGWHDSPISYGELGRIQLELPEGGQRAVPAVRLDPFGAAVWLSETPDGDDLSPSLAWFAALTNFAVRLLGARRVVPEVLDEGPFTVARWRPVLDPDHVEALAHAAASAPAICRNGSSASTDDIVRALVDGLARAVLHHAGWKPELGRKRSTHVQATRAVFAALAKHDPVIRTGTDEFHAEVDSLTRTLERHRQRLAGHPVVRGRVRLTIPDDPGDPWIVELELVDDADPGRWCTADDVWSESARALDLAGSQAQLATLRDEVLSLTATIAPHVPGLAELALEHEPTGVELELEQADDFIDVAPHVLQRLGIDLLGPEHLVRANVSVRGTASESPKDDRTARFGKEALVEWDAVVDDTPISAADLARAEAAGTTLMRIGHRWVRIDPAGLRRARAVLSEQVETHSHVGAVELLRMAAGHSPDGETQVELVVAGASVPDAEGATGGIRPTDERWIQSLLVGLPDERLEEAEESAEFVGELRHYQRRGLGWMQFLARVGLGGCLADDMGLGKTATTLAHLVERPGPAPRGVPAERRAQLGGRGTSLHAGSIGAWSTTGPAVSRASRRCSVWPTPTSSSPPTGCCHATSTRSPRSTGPRSCSTRPRWSRTPAPRRPRRCASSAPARSWRSPARRSRTACRELWAILDACNPGLLGSQTRFREQFADPIERRNDPEAAARLRAAHPAVRAAAHQGRPSLLPDLPDKIEQIACAQLTREQATLYQHVVDQLLVDAKELEGMQRRGLVLAALTRLKQICNHPAHALGDGSRLAGRSGKLTRFDELVAELLDVDERALVFTQFREMGELLQTPPPRALLDRRAVPARRRVASRARRAWSPTFQAGDGAAAAARVAQGRRHRPQPHRRQPGHPLRPVVEPGRRGPGHRPGVAHRPGAHRQRPQAGLPGHGRGAHRRR